MPRGRPSLAEQYINRKAGITSSTKRKIKAIAKMTAKQEVAKATRGRPVAQTQSIRVIGGKLRIKQAKSRVIRVVK